MELQHVKPQIQKKFPVISEMLAKRIPLLSRLKSIETTEKKIPKKAKIKKEFRLARLTNEKIDVEPLQKESTKKLTTDYGETNKPSLNLKIVKKIVEAPVVK